MTVLIIVVAWLVLSVPLGLAVAAFIARGCGPVGRAEVRPITTTPAVERPERDAA